MQCQLESMSTAGAELGWLEKLWLLGLSGLRRTLALVPTGRAPDGRQQEAPAAGMRAGGGRRAPGPRLQAGDRVRVRSLEEIQGTLDSRERCGGLPYVPVVMEKYCGGIFTVKKRVDRFFDERSWRMRKLRRVVILDGAYCEPPAQAGGDWAGCARTCFCFWKEDWLEKLSPTQGCRPERRPGMGEGGGDVRRGGGQEP